MITLLWYLVIAALVGGVVFVAAVFVFGRGEQMAPLPAQTSPAQLPEEGAVAASDVKALRFSLALRGYRMSDVDWALDRLGGELGLLSDQVEQLRAQVIELGGDPDRAGVAPVPVGAGPADAEAVEQAHSNVRSDSDPIRTASPDLPAPQIMEPVDPDRTS